MKKTLFILSAAALMVFAGCQKVSPSSDGSKVTVLSATLEQQDESDTKTYLEGSLVKWSEGDTITVFDGVTPYLYKLTTGQGTTDATFNPVAAAAANPEYAIYPYNTNPVISGSTITFTLPATQTYAANSFAKNYNVAVAAVTGSGMNFKNVCGSFKLQLKGSMKVKTIELSGKDNEKLNGSFKVNVTADPFVGAVKDGDPKDDTEKKLTLDCGEGVQLNFDTAASFYFVVPTGVFASGFEAKVIDVLGNTYYTTVSTIQPNTITRSVVKKMPSKAVTLLTTLFKEIYFLENSGEGEKINTNINGGNSNLVIGCKFSPVTYAKYSAVYSNFVDDNSNATRVFVRDDTSLGGAINSKGSGGNSYNVFTFTIIGTWFETINAFNSFTANGQTASVSSIKTGTANNNSVLLFSPGFSSNGRFRINYWYAKDSGTWVSYLVPAKRVSDDVLGMYDLVSKTFITNSGSGSMIAGPELVD